MRSSGSYFVLIEFFLKDMDRNEDELITIEEMYQMPTLCFRRWGWGGDDCFDFRSFPDMPDSWAHPDIFPQSDHFRRSGVGDRIFAFIFSALDSPNFSNVKGTYLVN